MRVTRVTFAALLLALVGCSAPVASPSSTPSPPAIAVEGTVRANADDPDIELEEGDPCTTERGYDDIHAGAQVTITDEAGVKLAVGELEPGAADDLAVYCVFPFTVLAVPPGRSLYSVHVGNQARGEVTYSEIQIRGPVSISIG